MHIEAEFVAKSNTYHDQNLVKEPYLIYVTSVNGQSLEKPIVMEYQRDPATAAFRSGRRYHLKAYETIHAIGVPRGWSEYPEQIDYQVVHRLVVKETEGRPGGQGMKPVR
jgi:hypothetical protein